MENWHEVEARGLGHGAAARPRRRKSPRTQMQRMSSLALERVAPTPLALTLNVKTACYRLNGQWGFVRPSQNSMRRTLPLKKRICRHDGRCQKFGRPRFFDDTFMSVASLLLSIGFQNGPRRNRDELTIPIPGIRLSQSIIQPAQWLSLWFQRASTLPCEARGRLCTQSTPSPWARSRRPHLRDAKSKTCVKK